MRQNLKITLVETLKKKQSLLCLLTEQGAVDYFLPALHLIQRAKLDINCIIYSSEDILKYLTATYRQILGRAVTLHLLTDDFFDNLQSLDVHPVGLISSASSRKVEYLFGEFAFQKSIPIIHLVDAFYGYKRRFITELGPIFCTNIVVIDSIAKSEAINEGLASQKLYVIGHPGWERLQNIGVQSASNRNTIFLGAPIRRDYGTSFGFDEHDAWQIVTGVKRTASELIDELVYCPHPTQTELPNLQGYKSLRYSSELLKRFGQVLGIFSAPLMHSYLAGGVSLSIQPNSGHTDVCAFSRRGLINRVQTSDELITHLRRAKPLSDRHFNEFLIGSATRLEKHIYRETNL